MKKQNIKYIIFFVAILLHNCNGNMVKDERLHFINKSQKSIYLTYSPDSIEPVYLFNNAKKYILEGNDTIWSIRNDFVKPKDTMMVPGFFEWDYVFEEMCPDKKCYFYFIDLNLYKKKLRGDSICKKDLYVKKGYSLKDFKRMNWTITYP